MTEREAHEELLASLEEWLDEDDVLGLYLFSWNSSHIDLPEDGKQRVYRSVFDELNRRHDLRLVWMTWPFGDPSSGVPAAPGTVLDFTLDPDDHSRAQLLALIEA